MKFLIDMNLSPLWVAFLSQQGFDAVHWSDVGSANAPDSEIMEFARTGGFAIVTHDLDFGMMLAVRHSSSPSVVQIRTQDVMPSVIGRLVVTALHAARSHLASGALVTVDAVQHRVRILPI